MTLIKRLWKYRKTVIVVSAAGFALGILFSLGVRKKYDVTCKIMPETINQKSVLSSLSSLGSALANLQNTTDALYPEVYPDIIRSYPFVADLMKMKVSLEDSSETNLFDYKLNHEKKGLFSRSYNDTIPSSFDVLQLTRRQDRVLRSIRRDISASVDKKTSMLTLKVTSRNPQLARDLSSLIIENLEKYLLDYYRSKSAKDLEYLEEMTEQAKQDYYEAQAKYARAVDSGQGLSLQQAMLRQQRLKFEMNLASQLYEQVSKKEQAARVKLAEAKPVIAVIQPAVTPFKGHPSRMKIVFIMTFLAFAASVVWVMFFKEELANADAEEK